MIQASLFASDVLGLMEKLFQGRLVLRTRCLECESFTERREDFQDISVPVLDDQPKSPEDLFEGEALKILNCDGKVKTEETFQIFTAP